MLEDYCHRLAGTKESFIVQPYRTQSPNLPPTDPAVVVRVISSRSDTQASIKVERAWLEIPLSSRPHQSATNGPVVVLDLEGHVLPRLGAPLTFSQQMELKTWIDLLKDLPVIIERCLDGSIEMHSRLPPINAVAWDWIPADGGPVLLEGNGCFSLLEPQLLEALSA
ncbi:MAG: hypothetical protein ACO4AI_14040 [Prochlorothrix sp.]